MELFALLLQGLVWQALEGPGRPSWLVSAVDGGCVVACRREEGDPRARWGSVGTDWGTLVLTRTIVFEDITRSPNVPLDETGTWKSE